MTLPLVVGVAGHRDLRPQDESALEQELSAFLSSLTLPTDPPPCALTSLAEGADRVFARVALSLGWRLVVILPFAQPRFEEDFPATVADFRKLLARSERTTVAPCVEGARPYVNAAQMIAAAAQVMVVLWDGVTTGDADGGTAYSVGLRSGDARLCTSLLSAGEWRGPTFWIHAPRGAGSVRHAGQWLPLGREMPSELVTGHLRRLREFNAEVARQDARQRAEVTKELHQIRGESRVATGLEWLFAHASVAANRSTF